LKALARRLTAEPAAEQAGGRSRRFTSELVKDDTSSLSRLASTLVQCGRALAKHADDLERGGVVDIEAAGASSSTRGDETW